MSRLKKIQEARARELQKSQETPSVMEGFGFWVDHNSGQKVVYDQSLEKGKNPAKEDRKK